MVSKLCELCELWLFWREVQCGFFFHTYGEFISEMLVTDTKIYKTDNIVLTYNILL